MYFSLIFYFEQAPEIFYIPRVPIPQIKVSLNFQSLVSVVKQTNKIEVVK